MKLLNQFGKDEADSLGGAVYNAVLSVNLDELNFLSSDILTDDTIILNNSKNPADMYFGFNKTSGGAILMDETKKENIDEQIESEINKSITNVNEIIKQYKETNKNTQLTDQQIIDVTNNMFEDEFILF